MVFSYFRTELLKNEQIKPKISIVLLTKSGKIKFCCEIPEFC